MAAHNAPLSSRDRANPSSVNWGWRVPVRALGCIATALLLASAAGCASKGPAYSKVPPAEIKVYATTDLLQSQYALVDYVWITTWRSAFTYPSFKSEADGLDAMKRAASDVGANGLINVICIDTRSKPSQKADLNCYGDAIRVN
jgi:predicted small lipoprotein YifL